MRDRIFISYSHADAKWLDLLKGVLAPLIRSEQLIVWDDRAIKPGAHWNKEISSALATAKVAVLLVTPDFLKSEFITKNELPVILEAAKRDALRVLWIAVRHSLYKKTEIEQFQSANDPDRPLAGLRRSGRDKTLVEISEAILAAYEETSPRNESPSATGAETSICTIRFEDYLWPDPISVKVAKLKLEKGDVSVEVEWPATTTSLVNAFAQITDEMVTDEKRTPDLRARSRTEIAELHEGFHRLLTHSRDILRLVPKRVPVTWQSVGRNVSATDYVIRNFLALANLEAWWHLAVNITYHLPTLATDVVPGEMRSWEARGGNLSMCLRANFARLFNLTEPIYDVEVLAIDEFPTDRHPYVFGPKEKVIGAALASRSGNPIINGWFFRYLVPQMEVNLATNSISTPIPYAERATLGRVHDERGNRVDL